MILSNISILSIYHGIHSPCEQVITDTGLADTTDRVSRYIHIEIIWTMSKARTITMSKASMMSNVNATVYKG